MKVLLTFLIVSLAVISAQIDPNCDVFDVSAAKIDPTYYQGTGGHAMFFGDSKIPSGIIEWDFYQNEAIIQNDGEFIALSGTLIPPGKTSPFLEIKMVLEKSKGSFPPHKELKPDAYVPFGPVDPQTWMYYRLKTSTIEAHGAPLEGMNIELSEHMDMPMQVGIGANGKNIVNGMSGWYNFKFTKDGKVIYTSDQVVDFNLNIKCTDCPLGYYSAYPADKQALFVSASDMTPFAGYSQWHFAENSGIVQLNPDFSITVGGVYIPLGKDAPTMVCTMDFYPDLDTFRSMKMELPAADYFPTGPVDVGTWALYRVNTTNSLCSVDTGYTIIITDDKNMPAQVGVGANGKNTDLGLSVWMGFQVMRPDGSIYQNPSDVLDINIGLVCLS
ncbi:hypothetical protein SAMD00019534_035590 [Acytostelium subglobosum LB1]|uniref:hypothetical protein n=1 Tax=Acytostelium subglobosum LB1 TaxID=1410327 RepID=UPI00064493B4|nr:hypothetical protein SAMD00019534_035590 [Acytostelium subglobosum LB1]GAM20384.1 hypothetical protein SAMD00019534_035590 [Acytostelium subglobosum LB1]|eukprot:XP_012759905.1 hypothetical protein SAMD00019534_035590 [Acytostelium subglobosum LB1]